VCILRGGPVESNLSSENSSRKLGIGFSLKKPSQMIFSEMRKRKRYYGINIQYSLFHEEKN